MSAIVTVFVVLAVLAFIRVFFFDQRRTKRRDRENERIRQAKLKEADRILRD